MGLTDSKCAHSNGCISLAGCCPACQQQALQTQTIMVHVGSMLLTFTTM
jgi:hypothetical protein